MLRLSEAVGSDEAAELLVDVLACALARSYGFVSSRHEPAMGDDGITFGVCVWRIAARQIAEEVQARLPTATISWPQNSMSLDYSGRRFHFYRAGSRDESIETYRLDGTATKVGIRQRNAEMRLFGRLPSERELPELVVLHTGPPGGSLEALHVGAPTSLDGNDTSWYWLEECWRLGRQEGGDEPGPRDPAPHDEGPLPDLQLRPRSIVDSVLDGA